MTCKTIIINNKNNMKINYMQKEKNKLYKKKKTK